jgi:hypothetical protein
LVPFLSFVVAVLPQRIESGMMRSVTSPEAPPKPLKFVAAFWIALSEFETLKGVP